MMILLISMGVAALTRLELKCFLLALSAAYSTLSLGVFYLKNSASNISLSLILDSAGATLTLMTVLVTLGCILATFLASFSPMYSNNFFLIMIFSVVVFSTGKILMFYVFFELSLIPITFLIMGWGYQPERAKAGIALMMYTIFASLPLLLVLVSLMKFNLDNFPAVPALCHSHKGLDSEVINGFLVLAFLVKLPMFLTHMWLPKAHVEAPVAGSMFLAAVLLKLGGIGLIRVLPLLSAQGATFSWSLSISSFGLVWIGLLCSSLVDAKSIIAYSSVAHMALGLMVLTLMKLDPVKSMLLILITHSTSSSFMFLQSFTVYTRSFSRSVLLSQGGLWWSGLFSLFWFMACVGMLGAPPTVNILGEVKSFTEIVSHSRHLIPFLVSGAFFAGAYSIFLFSSIFYSKKSKLLALTPLLLQESASMVFHLYWLLAAWGTVSWIVI